MTAWTPDWKLTLNGSGEFANVTLANMTITSGRTDIYQQPQAGYASFEVINFDEEYVDIHPNDQVTISVKDSSDVYVNVFGGFVTDIEQVVTAGGRVTITQSFRITALGALSKLPKALFSDALAKDFDGDQIYAVLEGLLYDDWNGVAPAVTWATYNATTTWANAENTGLGEIDQPGDYELHERNASTTDAYSLVASLASSGLGYIYENAQGQICYADSTHRSTYLATNGFTELSANDALAAGIRTLNRIGNIRNKVTLTYKNNQTKTAEDSTSIAYYGQQGQVINTSLENGTDAQDQADFYLEIRAYPQAIFDTITFELTNPELSDVDRDALLNVFMGLPINLTDLPANMQNGVFQGFVEGWTFRTGYNKLSVTLNVSPLAFTLQASRWNSVGAAETWNTLNASLEWIDATIVS
jgi:hypothetical protein